jgi:hypothetical protein
MKLKDGLKKGVMIKKSFAWDWDESLLKLIKKIFKRKDK